MANMLLEAAHHTAFVAAHDLLGCITRRLVVDHGIVPKPSTRDHIVQSFTDFLFKRVPLQHVWEKSLAREACIVCSLVLVEYAKVGDTICGELSAIKGSDLVRHSNRKIWLGPEILVLVVDRGACSALSISSDVGIVQNFPIGVRGVYI